MKYPGAWLLALVLAAGTATVSGQTTSNAKIKLEGRVVNSLTGQPIPRALVMLNAVQQRTMLTGPEGEFAFSGLPAGYVSIFAAKPGYFSPETLTPNGGFTPKSIQLGADTSGADLKLIPEAVISGQVLGKDEEPIEGASIEILSSRSSRGVRQLAPVGRRMFSAGMQIATNAPGTMRTDEDGKFRVAGLPPGNYYVAIKTSNVRRSGGDRRFPDPPDDSENLVYEPLVYHPGVTDFESAVPVQLSGGQHVTVDFTLKKVAAFKVSGSVKGPQDWKNLHPPMIVDATDQQLFSPDSYDMESGAFEFKALPAGTYNVRLSGSDQNQTVVMAMRKLTVDRPTSGVKFVMPPAQDIAVIVHKEMMKPLVKGTCTSTGGDGKPRTTDCSDWPLVAVQLNSPDGRSAGSAGFGHETDANNTTIKGVMPGRYSVRMSPRFGGYIASARSGSTDLLRDELLVPDEGSVPPIEVTLRDDTAGVRLRLKQASSAQKIWAVLVPDLFGRDPVVLALTPGSERDYSGLPPGDYQVLAFDSMDGIDTNSPELLQKYGDRATRISLSANTNTTVSIDVVKTGE